MVQPRAAAGGPAGRRRRRRGRHRAAAGRPRDRAGRAGRGGGGGEPLRRERDERPHRPRREPARGSHLLLAGGPARHEPRAAGRGSAGHEGARDRDRRARRQGERIRVRGAVPARRAPPRDEHGRRRPALRRPRSEGPGAPGGPRRGTSALGAAGGRLYVTTGSFGGIEYCPPLDPAMWEPPPVYSVSQAHPDPTPMAGRLTIFDGYGPGAAAVGTYAVGAPVADVAVVRDVAVLATAGQGLHFVDVSDPANPTLVHRVPFDETLSNSPGTPLRLRVVGDLLFVACQGGGPLLVDVSNPRAPRLVSGGNTEIALDALPVSDRLLLAGDTALAELSMPFTFVTGTTPERGTLVPPDVAQLQVRFNRALADTSVTADSVRLLSAAGAVGLGLAVTEDHQTLTYAVVA